MSHVYRSSPRLLLPLVTLLAVVSIGLGIKLSGAQVLRQATAGATDARVIVNAAQNVPSQQILANAQRQGFVVPDQVDRADPRQRLLLLTPGGPLLIELRLTLDGRPFNTPREEMVDAILQGANPPQGQEATWEAVLSLPRLVGGRFNRIRGNAEQLKRSIAAYDLNSNALAERYEVRMFLAQSYNGAAFGTMPANYSAGGASSQLFEVLDQNSDGVLSTEELADIQNRLKRRDVDDNELIETSEFSPMPVYNRGVQAVNAAAQPTGVILPMGPGTDVDTIRKAIVARYASDASLTKDKIPDSAALMNFLDQNENGTIDDNEWQRLNEAPPQIALEVNLGSGEGLTSGMKLLSLSEELGEAEKVVTFRSNNKLTLVIPSCHVELFSSEAVPTVDYQQTAQAMISRFDQDKNGYLELSEFGQMAQAFAGQFEVWDANGDGKVYVEEIRTSYEAAQRPNWDRVLVGGIDQGRAIFQHLDMNGDSRLSLRELRQAEARLRSLDQNGNGQVESNELPITLRVGIGRGTSVYQLLYSGLATTGGGFTSLGGNRTPGNPTPLAEPRWFSAMDRNGDDDLSPREFLGKAEQYTELDTDGDGLVSREEAKALKGELQKADAK